MATVQYADNTGVATTTDATTTTVVSADLMPSSAVVFTMKVVARRQSDNVSKGWYISFAGKRTGTGNASIIGGTIVNIIDPIGDLDALLWSATADASGGAVRCRVNGAASSTIDWYTELQANVLY